MQDTDIERIERACTALSISFARAIDFRDYDAFVELFTEDAVLDTGQPLDGLDAIRASLAGRDDRLRTRHVITNVFVDVLNADEARGIAYLTLYRHHWDDNLRPGPAPSAGPAAVGHYEDRFARTARGWRFRSRRLHVAFSDPAQFP